MAGRHPPAVPKSRGARRVRCASFARRGVDRPGAGHWQDGVEGDRRSHARDARTSMRTAPAAFSRRLDPVEERLVLRSHSSYHLGYVNLVELAAVTREQIWLGPLVEQIRRILAPCRLRRSKLSLAGVPLLPPCRLCATRRAGCDCTKAPIGFNPNARVAPHSTRLSDRFAQVSSHARAFSPGRVNNHHDELKALRDE